MLDLLLHSGHTAHIHAHAHSGNGGGEWLVLVLFAAICGPAIILLWRALGK